MIYLIGYMGSGKTTLAKKLSKQLQLTFLDTDFEIEKKENKSVSDIFKDKGEFHFRMLETEFLTQIKNDAIVACGGGIPMHNDNMSIINRKGVSIYLKASANYLNNRLKNEKKNRPLISKFDKYELQQFICDQLTEREKIYSKATYKISVDGKTNEEILGEIHSLI